MGRFDDIGQKGFLETNDDDDDDDEFVRAKTKKEQAVPVRRGFSTSESRWDEVASVPCVFRNRVNRSRGYARWEVED